jgi:hypothetical protein
MFRVFAAVTIATGLAGCTSAPVQIADRNDYLAEATRIYPKEQKERVIRAAEAIIKISDPNDVEVRYVNDGFTAIRRYFIYAVLAASSGQEKWEFHVDERAAAIEASLSISESGTVAGGSSFNHFDSAMSSVPLYRLFWKRMDYMLGRRPDWVTCEQEAAELGRTGTNTVAALGGLCGPTSDGRDSVPAPLPAVPVLAAERNAAARNASRAAKLR